MKLQASIEGENHDIEVTRDGDRLFARVDDRQYELEASEPEPNVYLLKHEARIFEIFSSPQKNAAYSVRVGSVEMDVTISDPKRLRGTAAGPDDSSGKAEIKTAMPGKVVRILKDVGDTVEKGEGVIVVEAMKMQNEMKSPKDGIVKELRVTESDTVGAGDVLVVIE
jgi:biotin carboxyl carrier protein